MDAIDSLLTPTAGRPDAASNRLQALANKRGARCFDCRTNQSVRYEAAEIVVTGLSLSSVSSAGRRYRCVSTPVSSFSRTTGTAQVPKSPVTTITSQDVGDRVPRGLPCVFSRYGFAARSVCARDRITLERLPVDDAEVVDPVKVIDVRGQHREVPCSGSCGDIHVVEVIERPTGLS